LYDGLNLDPITILVEPTTVRLVESSAPVAATLTFIACAVSSWRVRPTTDVLSVPLAITQTGVLTSRRFIDAAAGRGFKVFLLGSFGRNSR